MSSITPPLSLYIHMPWCIKKCPYCDFNSHSLKTKLEESQYIDALIKDLESALPLIWGRPVQSIFIGGGTPSLFSGEAINRLLENIRSRVKLSPFSEITLEANPGTVERQYIQEYKAAGINRISLGIQSFNTKHLGALGRIHNANEAITAINLVKEHFDNFNLDLIYGLANQTIDEVLKDLQVATSFSPTHISTYNLTIEPNTLYAKKPPANLPSNDLCYQMQDIIIDYLTSNNYLRYEISAFSTPGHQSQHNLNYWLFGDYLGLGAGAHSKLSINNQIIRQNRYYHPKEYLSKSLTGNFIQQGLIIKDHDLPLEFMMNSLRLINGFETRLFTERTGLSLSCILDKLLQAKAKNLVQLTPEKIIPTNKGVDFLNDLLGLFIK